MLHRLKSSNHFMAFFVQVCATALGLLIALGLDQWKTQRHEQANVQQARRFLVRELEANRGEVHSSNEKMKTFLNAIGALDELLVAASKGFVPPDSPLRTRINIQNLGYSVPELSRASWEAAVASQAMAHMPPLQVERFATAITIQQRLHELHDHLIQKTSALVSVIYLVGANPSLTLAPGRAQELHIQLQEFLILFQSTQESSKSLESAYDAALASCGAPKA